MRRIAIIISIALVIGSLSGWFTGNTRYYVEGEELTKEDYYKDYNKGYETNYHKSVYWTAYKYNYTAFFMSFTLTLGVGGLVGFGLNKFK